MPDARQPISARVILIETFIGEKMKLATYDKGQVIIDFVRLLEVEGSRKSYPDICW